MVRLDSERSAWLAELYESNLNPVFRTCARVLGNRDDAADASQEVFIIAAGSLQPGASKAQIRSWLQTVARNHCTDLLRRRKRLGRALAVLGVEEDPRSDAAVRVADRDFVDGILRKLSPRERQALWHSAVEHRGIGDIAGRLQLSYMATAQVIHRARKHALQLAARVAIVLGAIRLGRSASRVSLAAMRLAAVPVIAISAISIQSTGTPSGPARLPTVAGQASQAQVAPVAGTTAHAKGPVDPTQAQAGASSAITSAANGAQRSVKDLSGSLGSLVPGLPVTVPTPALPVISPVPTPLP
jgi:RNA polymerase sigma-70 factor, ECF subfamily